MPSPAALPRKHTRRLSRRAAAHVLIEAYDLQRTSRKGSAGVVGPLAVSLNADVWEQVVSAFRPLDEAQALK